MSSQPSGEQFAITHGSARAVITEIGAHLREFVIDGRNITVPFAADEAPPASAGAVLIPWPNRLRDGIYEFNGTTYQVPITEPDRRTALHGLVSDQPWYVVSHSDAALTLGIELTTFPGYPFGLTCHITYELISETQLTITTVARNSGQEPAPYGVGFHPWISPGPGGLDTASFELQVDSWMATDDRLLPTGWQPVPEQLNYSSLRNLAGSDLDDAFGEPLKAPDGSSSARVVCDDGVEVTIWADHTLPYWQVCTGNHVPSLRRQGIAVEPMSCVADAFRTGEALIVLQPGDTHTSTWSMSARGLAR